MKKLVLLLLFFSACEMVVDIDIPKDESRLVLNGFFNPDSTFSVSLYQSLHILDPGDFKAVEDAMVSIFDSEGAKVADLQDADLGRYTSTFKPEVGKEYRIEASKNGFETIQATDIVPIDSARINAIQIEQTEGEFSEEYEITFTIQDYAEEDFYEVQLLQRSVYELDGMTYEFVINHYMESDDVVFDDFNSSGTALLFNDVLFNAGESKITVSTFLNSFVTCDENPECANEEYFLILRKVSPSYFNYNRTLRLQQDLEGNPFAEPVSVYNNITNGFGIFAGFRNSVFPFDLPED